MKRFVLFAGSPFYPDGGWEDFHSDWDTLNRAVAEGQLYAVANDGGWWHVADTVTGEIAWRPCWLCTRRVTRVQLPNGTWEHQRRGRTTKNGIWVDDPEGQMVSRNECRRIPVVAEEV